MFRKPTPVLRRVAVTIAMVAAVLPALTVQPAAAHAFNATFFGTLLTSGTWEVATLPCGSTPCPSTNSWSFSSVTDILLPDISFGSGRVSGSGTFTGWCNRSAGTGSLSASTDFGTLEWQQFGETLIITGRTADHIAVFGVVKIRPAAGTGNCITAPATHFEMFGTLTADGSLPPVTTSSLPPVTTTSLPPVTTTSLPSVTTSTLLPGTTYPSDDCTSAPIIEGWAGNAYVRLRTGTGPGGSTWVCVATEAGVHVGGKLVVGSAAPAVPADDNVGACAAQPGNTVVRQGTIGPDNEPYRIDVTPRPNEVWVCVRLTSSVGKRLVVSSGNPTGTSFTSDATSLRSPPYGQLPPPNTGPSSTCQNAAAGKTRLANLSLGTTRAWLYTWQEPTRTHVCVRTEGPGGGGRLTVDSSGGTVATSTTDMSPCTFNVLTDGGPPPTAIRLSPPGAVPASVCLEVGVTRLRVSVGGGASPATWSPDS